MKKTLLVLVGLVLFGAVVFAESSGEAEVTGSSWDDIGPFVETVSRGRLNSGRNFFWRFEEDDAKTVRVTLQKLVNWANCPSNNETGHDDDGEKAGTTVWAPIDPNNNPCGIGGNFLVETTSSGKSSSSRKLLDPLALGILVDDEYILFFPGTDYSKWADYYFYKVIDRNSLEAKLNLENLYEINTATGEAKATYLGDPIVEPPEPEYYVEEKNAILKVGESFSDTHVIRGVEKNIVSTLKEIKFTDKCTSKETQLETTCWLHRNLYLTVNVTSKNSSEPEIFEIMLDEDGGGDTEKHILEDNAYYIARGSPITDNSTRFYFGKRIWFKETVAQQEPQSMQSNQEDEKSQDFNAGEEEQTVVEEKQENKPDQTGLVVAKNIDNPAATGQGTQKKSAKILPEQAKQKIKEKENFDCENIELTEKQEGLAYTCKTKQSGKLFGLFPMEFEVTAEISAEKEAEATVNRPWWSFLVFK